MSPIFLAEKWFWKHWLCPRCHLHRDSDSASWRYVADQGFDTPWHLLSLEDRLLLCYGAEKVIRRSREQVICG
jgi:hypothetical protein